MQLPEARVAARKHSLVNEHYSHRTEWTQAPRVSRARAGVLLAVTGPRHLMRELVHNGQAIQSITPHNAR